MKNPCAVVAFLIVCCLAAEAASDTTELSYLKVSEVQPGMKAIGKTVFRGSQVEEFEVELQGVMTGYRPGLDIILFKSDDPKLTQTGVIQGMSGSPVYVDDKLVGAVAYSWTYSRGAFGGITPAEAMLNVLEHKSARVVGRRSYVPAGYTSAGSYLEFLRNLQADQWQSDPPELLSVRLAASHYRSLSPNAASGGLVPIRVPLTLRGMGSSARLSTCFESLGFVWSGAAAAPEATVSGAAVGGSFEPGSVVVVKLADGDMQLSANGTVTAVSGNRFIALGHPLLGEGDLQWPVARGEVLMVVSNQVASFRIAAAGPIIGTTERDESVGMSGTVGTVPKMTQMHLTLTRPVGPSSTSRVQRDYDFDLVAHPLWTPLLISSISAEAATMRGEMPTYCTVRGRASIVTDHGTMELSSLRTGLSPLSYVIYELDYPVSALLNNEFAKVDVTRVDMAIEVEPGDRGLRISSARIDKSEVRRGDEIAVTIELQPFRDQPFQRTFSVRVPDKLPYGSSTILLTDAELDLYLRYAEQPSEFAPRSVDDLMRLLGSPIDREALYARFVSRYAGVSVGGKDYPRLPESVRDTIVSPKSTGAMAMSGPFRTKIETDGVISGSVSFRIDVRP